MKQITAAEQAAIATWLAKNKVTKCRIGESGLYDSFGDPLEKSAKAYREIAKKIRRIRNHKRLTCAQIADQLGARALDIRAACQRHQIEVKDATPEVRARPRRR